MKNLSDIILLFARARTGADRQTALYHASQSNRFDDEQRRILKTLLDESRQADVKCFPLRPLVNPCQEDGNLMPLTADGCPVLDDFVKADLTEWVDGWNNESGLLVNQATPPGALLLFGPTGSGKTTTARSLVSELKGRPAVVLEGHRIAESFLGSTGKNLGKAFDTCAKTSALLVIEELDGLSAARGGKGNSAEHENNRITIAVMRLLDTATFPVVATTNRMDDLDTALLRRFEFKLELLPLAAEKRRVILKNHFGDIPPEELVAMPLNESIPKIKRMKRARILERLNAQT